MLKYLFITYNDLSGDEPFSVYHAQMNLSALIYQLSQGNNPPLFELFLHFWIKLGSLDLLWLRLPSLIFSCLTLLYIFKIGNRFFTTKIAVFTCLLFVFSNYQLIFAQEVRVYSLFAFLTAASMYYFFCLTKAPTKRIYFWLLLTSYILIVYSHYFGILVVAMHFMSLLIIKQYREKLLKRYSLLLTLLLISYLPNLAILITRFSDTAKNGNWVPSPEGIESLYNIIWKFTNVPFTAVMSILILVAGLVVWMIRKPTQTISNEIKALLVWVFIPLLSLFTISYYIPMFVDRYLIFISVGFYLLLILTLDYLITKRWIKLTVLSLFVSLFIVSFNPKVEQKNDISKAVEKIRILKKYSTDVIVCPQHYLFNFTYYYDLNIFKKAENKLVKSDFIYAKIGKELSLQNVYGINYFDNYTFKNAEQVLFLDAGADALFPNNQIKQSLDSLYTSVFSYSFGQNLTLLHYKKLTKILCIKDVRERFLHQYFLQKKLVFLDFQL